MGQILKYSDNSDVLFSIHNQETNQENDLFTNKSGAFYDWLNNIEASSSIWNKRDSSQEAIIALGLIKKNYYLYIILTVKKMTYQIITIAHAQKQTYLLKKNFQIILFLMLIIFVLELIAWPLMIHYL